MSREANFRGIHVVRCGARRHRSLASHHPEHNQGRSGLKPISISNLHRFIIGSTYSLGGFRVTSRHLNLQCRIRGPRMIPNMCVDFWTQMSVQMSGQMVLFDWKAGVVVRTRPPQVAKVLWMYGHGHRHYVTSSVGWGRVFESPCSLIFCLLAHHENFCNFK